MTYQATQPQDNTPDNTQDDQAQAFVPQSLLINRLAEKDRKHANIVKQKDDMIADLQSKVQSAQAMHTANAAAQNVLNASGSILQQNTGAPMQTTASQPAPSAPVNVQQAPEPQPAIPMTPDQIEQIKQAAQIDAQQKLAQQQAQSAQDAQNAQTDAMANSLNQAKLGVMQKIDDAAKADPQLNDAIQQSLKNPAAAHEAVSLLIGTGDDAPDIFKKLMTNPDHYAAFTSPTSNPTTRAALLHNIGKEVTLENQGAPQKVQTANYATDGSKGQKSPDSMSAAELRQYYQKKGLY